MSRDLKGIKTKEMRTHNAITSTTHEQCNKEVGHIEEKVEQFITQTPSPTPETFLHHVTFTDDEIEKVLKTNS